ERHPAEALMAAIDALLDRVSTLRAGSDRLEGETRRQFDELSEVVCQKAQHLNLQSLLPPSHVPYFRGKIEFLGHTNLPVIFDLTGSTPFMTDHWEETLRKLRVAAEQLPAENPPAGEAESAEATQDLSDVEKAVRNFLLRLKAEGQRATGKEIVA